MDYISYNYSGVALQTPQIIDMQDIIGGLQFKWMVMLAGCAVFLFLYVIFNNFVHIKPGSKYTWLQEEMNVLAIIPAIFILVLVITYFSGFAGI